jgi:hypothetical protein
MNWRVAGGSVRLQLFLDAQLLFLEYLDHRGIGHWPAHFLLDAAFKAGMLELKAVAVRTIH